MAGAFQRHALRKAAEALGGGMELCQYLDVPSLTMFRWLRGRAPVPDDVMHKVISLLADLEAGVIQSAGQRAPGSSAEPQGRSRGQS